MSDLEIVHDTLHTLTQTKPVTTAPEIAGEIGGDRRRINESLRLLARNNEADSLEVGARARVWWPTPHPWREGRLGGTGRAADSGAVAGVVEQWDPGRNVEQRTARRQNGREVLNWLRERRGCARRGEFIAALYPDYADGDVSEDSWWRRQVRPLLKIAEAEGVVERDGTEWCWRE